MHRAYGTMSYVSLIYNGLKSVVTKRFEPTALFEPLIRIFYDCHPGLDLYFIKLSRVWCHGELSRTMTP